MSFALTAIPFRARKVTDSPTTGSKSVRCTLPAQSLPEDLRGVGPMAKLQTGRPAADTLNKLSVADRDRKSRRTNFEVSGWLLWFCGTSSFITFVLSFARMVLGDTAAVVLDYLKYLLDFASKLTRSTSTPSQRY
jgi:hypothetical protein